MAQNVSSVRVQIIGDSRGLNAELLKASKAVSEFGNRTAKSSFNSLNSQLSRVQRSITEVAESYVTGGKVQRSEIEKLIELERRLKRQIDARETAISAARGDVTPLKEVIDSPTAAPRAATQLRAVNTELSTTSQRSGRASLAITQLGFAAEDAAVVFGTTGLSGALRAAGNNLSFVAAMFSPIAGVVIGVGLALSALLIPRLFGASQAVDGLAESFRKLRRDVAGSTLQLRGVLERLNIEGINVEPVVKENLNRFQEQRRAFRQSRQLIEQANEQTSRQASSAASLDREDIFEKGPGAGGDLGNIRDAIKLRRSQSEFAESIQRRMTSAFEDAVESGDLSRIIKARKRIFNSAQLDFFKGDLPNIKLVELSEALDGQVKALTELASESIASKANIDQLNEALGQLSNNEAAANVNQSIADALGTALRPAFQVGGRFEGLFNNLVSGFQADFGGTATNERRNALAQADPLQAGFKFGSVEAISAINRATFSRPDPVEKDIEKNTSQTVDAVRDVISEVKNLGTAITTGIGNAITAGSPL